MEAVNEAADITNTNEPALVGVKENNDTVAAYVNFVNSKVKMSLDHAYANEALLKLIDPTNTKANVVEYEVRADLEKVKGICKNDYKRSF